VDERIAELRRSVVRRGEATPEDIDAIDDILEGEGPTVDFLLLRGQMIQLIVDAGPDELEQALACFEEALELDPSRPEPYEEIAHFMDDVADDPEEAEPFFRKAIELGAGESAREGLREVLGQLGRYDG
jgi:tetratricopeptide (TPR) repeat protein